MIELHIFNMSLKGFEPAIPTVHARALQSPGLGDCGTSMAGVLGTHTRSLAPSSGDWRLVYPLMHCMHARFTDFQWLLRWSTTSEPQL